MKRDRNPGEKKKGQPLDQVVNSLMARKSDDFLPDGLPDILYQTQ